MQKTNSFSSLVSNFLKEEDGFLSSLWKGLKNIGGKLIKGAASLLGFGGSGGGAGGGTTVVNNNIPGSDGVGSVLGGGQPAQGPAGGSKFWDLVKGNLSEAFQTGIQSVIAGPINRYNAKQQGLANRGYLDASFPELNPWEKAGATATAAGTQVGQQNIEERMQKRELKTREKLQENQLKLGREQLATQERVASTHANASITSAGITSAPAADLVASNIELNHANAFLNNMLGSESIDRNQRQEIASARNIIAKLLEPGLGPNVRNMYLRQLAAIAAENTGNGLGSVLGGVVNRRVNPQGTSRRRGGVRSNHPVLLE